MAEATRPSGGASYAPVVDTIGLPYTPGRLAKAAAIDSEEASDLFFKVQGAWTRRDLSSVRPLLGPEVYEQLSQDVEELRSGQKINRLENITIREAQEINSWQEQGADHTTVRFRANLLDYTVDERSQALLEGSDSVPVKFNEDWTFAREATGQPWRLVGIEQIS
jgi:predicted lipid-binding transport protein (Tim44 family)